MQDTSIHQAHINDVDPLLSSLVFLSKFYGQPFSAQALSSGLPLQNGRLSYDLLPRAALRAGMDAAIHKKSLGKISSLLMPCILLLKDGGACVLLKIENEQAHIAWPELSDAHDSIALDALEQQYLGFCCYVRRRYRFDERSQQANTLGQGHWFWSSFRYSLPLYRDAFLASFFISLFALASPLFVMNVYDRVVPNAAIETLWVLAIGMLVLLLFDFIFKQLRSHFFDLAGKKSDILLSAKVFEKLLSANLAQRPQSLGAFARNVQEFDAIREFIASATMTALIDAPFCVLFLVIIAVVAGPLCYIPLIMGLIMLAYSLYIKRRLRQHIELGEASASQKNAHLIETLGGIETLKLASAEGQFQARWEQLVGDIANWNIALRKLSNSVSAVNGFCQQATTVMIVVAGVYLISMGELSMGALVASVMLSSRALVPFSQVSVLATRYNQAKLALNSLEELMALPDEQLSNAVHRRHYNGDVSFANVSFTYPNYEKPVLNAVSFDIKAGERVAIIGRIGAGKTTIEKLLLGFYRPDEGAIRLDGLDIKQISLADLRQKIGCLAQDVSLFYGSIRDNITLGVPHIDDALVLEAARRAGVNQFTDIDPQGLDRQVGERGMYLSGGQRQAVALARALLFNPPVLVLDEPANAMDAYSERHVINQLKQLSENKTLVLITHKMSMLELVDRIIVLERGQVVADGDKEQVLKQLRGGQVRAAS